MRTLALDIGDVRIGCALSDPNNTIASPLTVISYTSIEQAKREIVSIVEEYEVGQILIGLPLSLAGEEGPQARHIRSLASKLLDDSSLPIHYFDERLSSTQAKDALASGGVSERKARGSVDKIAAALFLQAWLDR